VTGLTPLGQALKKRPTDAEKLLWSRLRARQLEGLKFRRQQPLIVTALILFALKIVSSLKWTADSMLPKTAATVNEIPVLKVSDLRS
jgi:hypothetical protein